MRVARAVLHMMGCRLVAIHLATRQKAMSTKLPTCTSLGQAQSNLARSVNCFRFKHHQFCSHQTEIMTNLYNAVKYRTTGAVLEGLKV